jgi:hypothetical protein
MRRRTYVETNKQVKKIGGKYFGGKYFGRKYFGGKYFGGKYFGGKYFGGKYFGGKYFGAKYFGAKYFDVKYFFREDFDVIFWIKLVDISLQNLTFKTIKRHSNNNITNIMSWDIHIHYKPNKMVCFTFADIT